MYIRVSPETTFVMQTLQAYVLFPRTLSNKKKENEDRKL